MGSKQQVTPVESSGLRVTSPLHVGSTSSFVRNPEAGNT